MSTKKEWDDFAAKWVPELKKQGYIKEKTNLLWMILTFVLAVSLIGVGIYELESGAFKSVNNQTVDIITNVSVNPRFDFNPETNNNNKFDNNYTIINKIYYNCNQNEMS